MRYEIRHNPSFSVARCFLDPGQSIKINGDGMMAMGGGVSLDAQMEGGMFKALKRAALGGQSFFISTITAGAGAGWADIAPMWAGDILAIESSDAAPVCITKGSWLCSDSSVELDTKWAGFKSAFGSEGGFAMHTSGSGTNLVTCFGALDRWELGAGEQLTLDSGHVVAYDPAIQYNLRMAGGGAWKAIKSSEGFVFDFVGPGWIMSQTRNPSALENWVRSVVPTQSN